ncbi:hypothetical protein D3C87_1488080 [compost metagenome]
MKKILFFFILTLGIISCNSDESTPTPASGDFQFTTEYSATIAVGGFVGIVRTTYKVGEVYKGTDEGKETIRIRIAEHTTLNDNCPSNTCYQEFLDVPRTFLKFVK